VPRVRLETGAANASGRAFNAVLAAHLHIDTIEQAFIEATSLTQPLGPVGYLTGNACDTGRSRPPRHQRSPVTTGHSTRPAGGNYAQWRHRPAIGRGRQSELGWRVRLRRLHRRVRRTWCTISEYSAGLRSVQLMQAERDSVPVLAIMNLSLP